MLAGDRHCDYICLLLPHARYQDQSGNSVLTTRIRQSLSSRISGRSEEKLTRV